MTSIKTGQKFLTIDNIINSYQDTNGNDNYETNIEEKYNKNSKGKVIYDKLFAFSNRINHDNSFLNQFYHFSNNLINNKNKKIVKLQFAFIITFLIERFLIRIMVTYSLF